jgi:hypothetical protein
VNGLHALPGSLTGGCTTAATCATWAIESGIELWYLARVMGTSVVQIEDTYARWLKRTDDQLRAAFDAYDARATSSQAL